MGAPVIKIFLAEKYFRFSSKATKIRSANREAKRLERPGEALGSTMATGIFLRFAINTKGPETYPPIPTTQSGECFFNNFFACIQLFQSEMTEIIFFKTFFPDNVGTSNI